MSNELNSTRAKFVWSINVLIALALFILLAYGVKARDWDPFWFGQLGSGILSTYLSAAIIGFLYEVLVRRFYLKEAIEMTKIAESVEHAGIVHYGSDFPRYDFSTLLHDAHEIDIYFCYGGTWVEQNRKLLVERLSAGANIRVYLADRNNDHFLEVLARKWKEPVPPGQPEQPGPAKYSVADLKNRIDQTLHLLPELYKKAKTISKKKNGRLEIFFTNSDVPHSFYRADSRIVLVFTKMCRDKDYPVHYVEAVDKGGKDCLFNWVMGDLKALGETPGRTLAWDSNDGK